MTLPITFHEAAALEVIEAAGFYERECPGLGATFLDEVQTALRTLGEFPEGAPLLRGRLRRKVLLRFPYILMYSVRAGQIRILAVAHEKRRPFYWRERQ
jgi:plasmid stabilization system protein ParE